MEVAEKVGEGYTFERNGSTEETETEADSKPLHSVFIDLTLENDLKGEELEWFRERIQPAKVEGSDKKDKERGGEDGIGRRKVQILTARDLERSERDSSKLYLRMSETETIWLMTLHTLYSEENEADAERVRRENETYLMKKTKKELIRKRCMADAQTPIKLEKTRGTLTTAITKKNAVVFASQWDLYDTYNAFDESELTSSKKFLRFSDVEKVDANLENQDGGVGDNPTTNEERIAKIQETENFRYATLVTERLLASNCYRVEQSTFKTKFTTRYDCEPTTFSYEMTPLWNFHKDFKKPLMVTDLDWNPLNQDLLAVGYGHFNFLKMTSGLVCIWSPKNPRQPERQFHFDEAVTCLNYSRSRPNVLAVGTRKGKVFVLDVASHGGGLRLLERNDLYTPPEPVWKVEWFQHRELTVETEELLAVGESGILMLFSFSNDDVIKDILKMNYVASEEAWVDKKNSKKSLRRYLKLTGVEYRKKTFSGLCFSIFDDRKFCYISTKEGVLVKCNLRNPSMMDAVIPGHEGPAYVVLHSPITDLVYLTCGADWRLQIWMEGISKPLLSLQNKGPVRCARWSPTIPTMIATVADAELSLWDISRNTLTPVSWRKFDDTEKPFSSILFSRNGKNIVVGGEDGLVRVVHLSQLPRIPFLQKEALVNAIKNGLHRNKEMIGEFCRMVEIHREKLTTQVEL